MPDQPTVVVPPEGRVFVLRFDGHAHVLFWGSDESGLERFASSGRKLLRWDSANELERDARERGWVLDPIEEYDASDDIDLEPAQRWLRGVTNTVDPDSTCGTRQRTLPTAWVSRCGMAGTSLTLRRISPGYSSVSPTCRDGLRTS